MKPNNAYQIQYQIKNAIVNAINKIVQRYNAPKPLTEPRSSSLDGRVISEEEKVFAYALAGLYGQECRVEAIKARSTRPRELADFSHDTDVIPQNSNLAEKQRDSHSQNPKPLQFPSNDGRHETAAAKYDYQKAAYGGYSSLNSLVKKTYLSISYAFSRLRPRTRIYGEKNRGSQIPTSYNSDEPGGNLLDIPSGKVVNITSYRKKAQSNSKTYPSKASDLEKRLRKSA